MKKLLSSLVLAFACVLTTPSTVNAQGTDQVSIINGQDGITLYINQYGNMEAQCLVDMNPIGERKYLLRVERFIACDVMETVEFEADEPQSDQYCMFNFVVEFAWHFTSMEADFWRFTAILETVEGLPIYESLYVDITFS